MYRHHYRAAIIASPAQSVAISAWTHVGQPMQRAHVHTGRAGSGHGWCIDIEPQQRAQQLAVAPVQPRRHAPTTMLEAVAMCLHVGQQRLQINLVQADPQPPAVAIIAKISNGMQRGAHSGATQGATYADAPAALSAHPQLPGEQRVVFIGGDIADLHAQILQPQIHGQTTQRQWLTGGIPGHADAVDAPRPVALATQIQLQPAHMHVEQVPRRQQPATKIQLQFRLRQAQRRRGLADRCADGHAMQHKQGARRCPATFHGRKAHRPLRARAELCRHPLWMARDQRQQQLGKGNEHGQGDDQHAQGPA